MMDYFTYSVLLKCGMNRGQVVGEYNKFVIGIVVLFQRAHVKTLYLQSIITYLGSYPSSSKPALVCAGPRLTI